jgi:hypothetical protein
MWFSSCQGPFDSSKKVLAKTRVVAYPLCIPLILIADASPFLHRFVNPIFPALLPWIFPILHFRQADWPLNRRFRGPQDRRF